MLASTSFVSLKDLKKKVPPPSIEQFKRMSMRLSEKMSELWDLDKKDPVKLYISLPHQWPLYKAAGSKKYRFMFMSGGNRRGKTDWLTTDCALWLMGEHPFMKTPKRAVGWMVCLTDEMWGNIIVPKLRVKMKPGMYEINNQKKTLIVTNGKGKGNRLVFKSDEQKLQTFEGARVDRVWIDEEISQQRFNAVCVRTADTGAQILIAATLINGLTYLYEDFVAPTARGERTDVIIDHGNWEDNPILEKKTMDALRDQVAREDEMLARIRFGGEFLSLEGRCVFDGAVLTNDLKKSVNTIAVPWMGA
jgi:hypothetical protein